MQLKTADHKYANVMEPICTQYDNSPNDRQLVFLKSQLYSDTTFTEILQPINALTEDGDIAFLRSFGHTDHMLNYSLCEKVH